MGKRLAGRPTGLIYCGSDGGVGSGGWALGSAAGGVGEGSFHSVAGDVDGAGAGGEIGSVTDGDIGGGLDGVRPRRIISIRTNATTTITRSRISHPTVSPDPAPSSRFSTDGLGLTW
jgi:hypothetical protein